MVETFIKYNRYVARIPRGMRVGGGGGGVVDSLSFDVQERGAFAQFGPIQTDKKRGGRGGAKIGRFSWMS